MQCDAMKVVTIHRKNHDRAAPIAAARFLQLNFAPPFISLEVNSLGIWERYPSVRANTITKNATALNISTIFSFGKLEFASIPTTAVVVPRIERAEA